MAVNEPLKRYQMVKTISRKFQDSITRNRIHIVEPAEKFGKDPEVQKISFPTWIRHRLKEFCSVTALHGYSHIIREDYETFERIIWAVAVFTALVVAIILLWISWHWNAETPTVTVIESTHYATWNIPFPAITICNMNRFSKSALLKRALSLKLPSKMLPEELAKKMSMLIYFQGVGNGTDEQYKELHDILTTNNLSVKQLISELPTPCNEMLEKCMWKGTQWRCDNLFQPVNTSVGQCCSFNYYGLSSNNYPKKMTVVIPKQPRKVTACGYQTGLSVLMRPFSEDYHSTGLSSYGFRVLIHNSYDFPAENAELKLVASKLESFIGISPEATYSTPQVDALKPSVRNCLLYDESKLNVMQQYTYVNCLAECRSRIVASICGCVPYTLPNNGSYPVCEMNKLRCVQQIFKLYKRSVPVMNITSQGDYCGCLPDCQLIQYPSQISSSLLNRKYSFNSFNFFKDINLTDQSLLHIFFNDLVSTHYRKDIYQNWLNVLASFGGLLGLFLGFSLVTGFELIYFFTIRVFFDRLATKKNVK